MKLPRFLVSLLIVAAASASASAAVYLKIEGIPGESKDKMHAGWIEADVQTDLDVNTTRGAVSGLSTGQRMHKPYVVRRAVDQTSPLLFKAMVAKQEFGQVTVSRPGGRVALSNVRITNITTAGGMETITFAYQKIEVQPAAQAATAAGSTMKEKSQPPKK